MVSADSNNQNDEANTDLLETESLHEHPEVEDDLWVRL